MSITTYAELQTACENWLHRSGLTDRIPEFISIGEARIGREVRARQMETRVSTTPTSKFESLPSDFLAIRAVRIKGSDVGWMSYISPEQMFTQFASGTDSSRKFYTIFGDELCFPQTPTGDIELWYYKRLTALSSAVNGLFTANPDLYLYAAMAAAQPFMVKDARIPVWEAQYLAVRDAINKQSAEGRYPSGGLSVKSVS